MNKQTFKNLIVELLSYKGMADMRDYSGIGRLDITGGRFSFRENTPKTYRRNPVVAENSRGDKVFMQKDGMLRISMYVTRDDMTAGKGLTGRIGALVSNFNGEEVEA